MKLNEEIKLLATDGKRRTHVVVKCKQCNKLFPKMKRKIGKYPNDFCSHECKSKNQIKKIEVQCGYCGKNFRIKPFRVKDNNFCDRICKEKAQSYVGNRLLHCGKETGMYSYRILALANHGKRCEICQYDDIINLLDSHHIDHDRTNFSIENLMVLCVMCHAAETRKIIKINEDRSVEPIGDKGLIFLKNMGCDAKGA